MTLMMRCLVTDMDSYYEKLCKKLGIKIPFYVQAVRNADKDAARKRRALEKPGKYKGRGKS